jgi:hypothetical protein
MKFISLDLSHQDDFNELKMIKIQLLDRIRNFENIPKLSKILRIFI